MDAIQEYIIERLCGCKLHLYLSGRGILAPGDPQPTAFDGKPLAFSLRAIAFAAFTTHKQANGPGREQSMKLMRRDSHSDTTPNPESRFPATLALTNVIFAKFDCIF
jgi:hypothetical protein